MTANLRGISEEVKGTDERIIPFTDTRFCPIKFNRHEPQAKPALAGLPTPSPLVRSLPLCFEVFGVACPVTLSLILCNRGRRRLRVPWIFLYRPMDVLYPRLSLS